MKNKFVLIATGAILISLIFGALAWQQLLAENMDEVYLNTAYSTLCLSISLYVWHMKDEKQNNR